MSTEPTTAPDPDAAFWAAFHAAEDEADAAVLGLTGAGAQEHAHSARAETARRMNGES